MRTKQSPLVQEATISAIDPRQERLMQLCGIKELPPVHTKQVLLEKIIMPDEALVRPSARFLRSIELVGIRQPPSVAFCRGTAWDADDAFYIVVMGRRRVASARKLLLKGDLRFQAIKCEVYEQSVPRLNAFLGLLENEQRSEAWRQEIIQLRQLTGEDVAISLDDLAAYGFDRRTIKRRLEIALLPAPILDQICSGGVDLSTTMQICRLQATARERLCTLAASGEAITAELVSSLLKRQVNQGFATVHLAQFWTKNQEETLSSTTRSNPPSVPSANRSEGTSSSGQVLAVLRQFEQEMQQNPTSQRVAMLTHVLIKEMEIALRTSPLS